MKEGELVEIRTRRIGEESVISKVVPKASLKEFRDSGWVGPGEPIPDPQVPDVEVLELLVKDAEADFEKAQHGVSVAQGKLQDAHFQHRSAKEKIAKEPEIKARLAKEGEIADIRQRTLNLLIKAGNNPVPLSSMLAYASSNVQTRYIQQTYISGNHVVGKTEGGDYLIVENKYLYDQAKAEREANEKIEKERAIRARMEANA